jgi:hypothetical protein
MDIVIGAGGPNDKNSLPLATRKNKFIHNEQRLERAPSSLKAAATVHLSTFPQAKLRSATAVYNCMGLVFASRRTWIDTDYLNDILIDDGYIKIAGPEEAKCGDIVIYRMNENSHITHVAIIVDIKPEVKTASWKITVLSQWGADGEYIHFLEEVPTILGEPVEYWTDRRTIK